MIEFRDQGFAAARINRIAELARVSKRTLYKHFESKEALFDAIVERVLSENAAIPSMSLQRDCLLETQLAMALRQYIEIISKDNYIGLTRVMISEFLRDQEMSRRVFERTEMHNNPITGLIGEAMEAGLLRQADSQYAATQLLSLVKTFFFWPKFLIGDPLPNQASGDKILADCISMFLSHYRREDEE